MPAETSVAPTSSISRPPDSGPHTERAPAERDAARRRFFTWERTIGELVLIVAGVLIGLAVNNWNANRQQRQLELTMLHELRAALTGDLTTLRDVEGAVRVRETRMATLLAALDRGGSIDSADVLFGSVLRIWEWQLNRSVYETLKAKGLDLISSDPLRLRIAALYENTYVNLDQSEADDRSVVFELVRPYYLKNFRAIRFGESATPLSYATVIHDPYFRNLLEYRLASARSNPIKALGLAIPQVSDLIASVDSELARR